MKIALITDQHFGARNDSNHLHNHFAKFYSECFFPHLEKEGITNIIELGDIFDRRKFVNYDSLYRCRDYFFNPIKEKGYTLHCIVGNHDIYFKSTNRVNSPKLLLSEYDFPIYDSATEVVFDNSSKLSISLIRYI
jgi:metallophosphoesterase superfamily enzyme